MATQTQTHDSHQASTSDEQTKKFSEAVKVREQINLCSPQQSVEEKGKGDKLHILDTTLPTSEAKAVDEPPVCERPSNEPIGGEATELPGIAFLEKGIKEEFDAADNKGEVIQKESLEVEDESSSDIVDCEEEEGEEEKVEEKKAKITDEEEKEGDKEAENNVPEEAVEPQKKEGVPMEEMIGTAEAPTEKEQAVEVDSSKGLEEVIARKEKEKEEAGEESREVIETKISERVEVWHESGFVGEKEEPAEVQSVQGETISDPVVAGKSLLVDLIAETKIEEPQVAALGAANVSELEVKDEQSVSTKGEVPTKPTHKHSHNLLSKLKHSLVKARKAIIGKSPTAKTLSSQPRDDIKVK